MIISGAESSYTAREHAAIIGQAPEPQESFSQYLAGEPLAEDGSSTEGPAALEQKTLEKALADFGHSPLFGFPALLHSAPASGAAKYEFYGLWMQCHDEVVSEMAIDLDQYGVDRSLRVGPEGRAATNAIYEKLAKLPQAQELMQTLGFTEVTEFGIPYNPKARLIPYQGELKMKAEDICSQSRVPILKDWLLERFF